MVTSESLASGQGPLSRVSCESSPFTKGVKAQTLEPLTGCLWKGGVTSLCLSFTMCKEQMMSLPPGTAVRVTWVRPGSRWEQSRAGSQCVLAEPAWNVYRSLGFPAAIPPRGLLPRPWRPLFLAATCCKRFPLLEVQVKCSFLCEAFLDLTAPWGRPLSPLPWEAGYCHSCHMEVSRSQAL